MLLLEEKRFYVYIYLNPLKPGKFQYKEIRQCFLFEPFYIGIGKEDRLYYHLREINFAKISNRHKIYTIKKIIKHNLHPIIFKLHENLNHKQACELEIHYISSLGRRDLKTGCLTNLTDGGEGVVNLSPEIKKKHVEQVRKIKKERNIPNPGSLRKGKTYEEIYGEERTKEIKESLLKAKQQYYKNNNIKRKPSKKLSEEDKKIYLREKAQRVKNKHREYILNTYSDLVIDLYFKGYSRKSMSEILNTTQKNISLVAKEKNIYLGTCMNTRLDFIKNNYNFYIYDYPDEGIKRISDEINNRVQNYKKTLEENPEINVQRSLKIEQSKNLQTEERKREIKEKQKSFFEDNPEVIKERSRKYRETLKNNPDIVKNRIEKTKQLYIDNPDKKIKEIEKTKETLKNNPDIVKNMREKRKQTLNTFSDEKWKEIGEKINKTKELNGTHNRGSNNGRYITIEDPKLIIDLYFKKLSYEDIYNIYINIYPKSKVTPANIKRKLKKAELYFYKRGYKKVLVEKFIEDNYDTREKYYNFDKDD